MDILAEVKTALDNLERVVLATTIASSGSTPLPSGATMMVKPVGDIVMGTVGGGVLEAEVIDQAKGLIAERGGSLIRRFELSDTASDEGMICGGSVEVLFEVIEESDRLTYTRLHNSRNDGNDCAILRILDKNHRVVERLVLENFSNDGDQQASLTALLTRLQIPAESFDKAFEKARRQEMPARIEFSAGEIIVQPIIGFQPLIVFGGGHVGCAVSKIASRAGFTVTIVDDREEYANAQRFPDAVRVLPMQIDVSFNHLDIKSSTSIVIVTRGHQLDGEVLARAVTTPARYIGMIGSSRKVIATYERLLKQGVPLDALKRVHAPIGLDIGAVTAEEIAVSIVAELIRARRGVGETTSAKSENVKQWLEKQG